jgi:prepilin-type N-terminal cleavage/methylation domain-containing protein
VFKKVMKPFRKSSGFSLVEVMLVVAIISILTAGVITKTNILKHLGLTYDVQRQYDIVQLRKALLHALIDGIELPTNVPREESQAKWICQYSKQGIECVAPPIDGIDLSKLVPAYLPEIPEDPEFGDTDIAGYKIYRDGEFFIVMSPFLEE